MLSYRIDKQAGQHSPGQEFISKQTTIGRPLQQKLYHMKPFLLSVIYWLWQPTTTDVVMCRWHLPGLTNIFCLGCSPFCITVSSGFSCSTFFFWSLPCHCNLLHHLRLSLDSQLFNLGLKNAKLFSESNKHVKRLLFQVNDK